MLQAIFDAYVTQRLKGVDANDALLPLRPRILKLSETDRAELVRLVRDWEKKRPDPAAGQLAADQPTVRKIAPLKPIGETQPQPAVHPPADAPPAAERGKTIECPKCRRIVPATEVFCPTCGTFLQDEVGSAFKTVRLEDDPSTFKPDYFGATSTLVLFVRHNKNQYRIQPQSFRREIIIGRSDGSAPVTPDIDLANQDAGKLGVSRMHLSLSYDPTNDTLSVTDLRSSNGSFVNNQRLHSHEVRVLRTGDELRLGKLVLGVVFQHPQSE
jgi:hypothetical protein